MAYFERGVKTSLALPLSVGWLALALLLVGCGGGGSGAAASPSMTAVGVIPSVVGTPAAPLPAPVANALRLAAQDAGVPAEQATLIAYTREEFASAALGCPEPGKGYAQVITPGYDVRARVGGQEVEYHTDLDQTVVRCTAP